MHKYIVWLYSYNSGGYDHQFYEMVTAHSREEAERIIETSKYQSHPIVTRVETWKY